MTQTKNKAWRGFAAAVGAGALLLSAGAAQAALQDRDLDGNGQVDAFYDTDLNITWLRDANVNGKMDWNAALAWVAGFSFAGYDDWRLPSSDECIGLNCTGSEMGHLWYIELGNVAGTVTANFGNFQNMQKEFYWSGSHYTPVPAAVVNFRPTDGYQSWNYPNATFYALAVRPGDVPAIPEPQTYALLLAGLGTVAVAARRRAR